MRVKIHQIYIPLQLHQKNSFLLACCFWRELYIHSNPFNYILYVIVVEGMRYVEG